jgi:hypothetical protein
MRAALLRQRQRGVALMAMLAVLILGATWWTVTALSNTVNRTAEQRAQNAQVLQQAKAAVMGWVAHQAAMSAEADPGRLPCPELAANIGTANQGLAANTCALPAVGRLPWRTLGLDQLRDAAGEPLWYVVSPGWALDGIVANTVINSNSTGALTLDAAGDVVALIMAPGAPLAVTDAGCTPRNQVRAAPGNVLDYLECANVDAVPNVFASNGPAGSFNDQLLAITAAELMPLIEASVADRFRRNVAPLLRSAYSNSDAASGNGNPSWPDAPLLPFAATLAGDPALSSFKGVAVASPALSHGLLPLTYSTDPATGVACDPAPPLPAPADPRCDPAFISWQTVAAAPPAAWPAVTVTNGTLVPGFTNCNASSTLVTCTFRASYSVFAPNITVTVTHRANNVGGALRQFNTNVAIGGGMQAAGRTAAGAAFNADGSANLSITGTMPVPAGADLLGDLLCNLLGLIAQLLNNCGNYTVTVPIGLMVDHPLIQDSAATNPQHWFLRNRWHHVSYYAVSPDSAPGGAGACAANCLALSFARDGTLNPPAETTTNVRSLLAIAGRSIAGQVRPPLAVTDWLEDTNADANLSFGMRATGLVANRTFNDRITAIDP